MVYCMGVARIVDWGGGLNRKSHVMMSSKIFEKRDFLWDKEWKIKRWGSDLAHNQDLLKVKA